MQDIYDRAGRLMRMSDDTWARHANPWSVYTRFSILPLATVVFWFRADLGWWVAPALVALGIWVWINPRAFPPPACRDSWAAHGTFGERVFLNRSNVPIPRHHAYWAHGLGATSGLGVLIWAYGLWQLDLGWTGCGLAVAMGAKTWFVDRMVWLYRDLAPSNPDYATWSK